MNLFESKHISILPEDPKLLKDMKRMRNMITDSLNVLQKEGSKILQDPSHHFSASRNVILPWARKLTSSITTFQFIDEEKTQSAERADGIVLLGDKNLKKLEDFRSKLHEQTDEIIDMSNDMVLEMATKLKDTLEMLRQAKAQRLIATMTANAAWFKTMVKHQDPEQKEKREKEMNDNEAQLQMKVNLYKKKIEKQISPTDKLTQMFDSQVKFCGRHLASIKKGPKIKIGVKEPCKDDTLGFDFVFPSESFIEGLKYKLYDDICDLQMNTIFNSYDNPQNYGFIFNFKLSNEMQSNIGDRGFLLKAYDFDQFKTPVHKIEMYYDSELFRGVAMYEANGKEIQKVGECSGHQVKQIFLDPNELLIGCRGRHWKNVKECLSNFQFLTMKAEYDV